MAKRNRCGKAEVLTNEDYKKLKDCLPSARDRLIAALAYWTGERLGAILQLEVEMVYSDPRKGVVLENITFPSRSRKGKRDTRQTPIHPTLREMLQAYQPPLEGWLFPSPRKSRTAHLSFSAFDKTFRQAAKKAGLSDLGISSHSFRRTFISHLHDKGHSLKLIQSITKHRSISSLVEYIEIEEETIKQAIFSL